MVFTLVMILALGVSPALQPPSPKPPTQLLRGLYLLACVLSAFVGAGLGVFLYKLAKYWVNAAGGFALAWYILALRPGGTIENVIGRWGLIGGMSVGAFIAGLPNPLNPYLVLLSTAWIGATAFILGVDCYTRAGLKEVSTVRRQTCTGVRLTGSFTCTISAFGTSFQSSGVKSTP